MWPFKPSKNKTVIDAIINKMEREKEFYEMQIAKLTQEDLQGNPWQYNTVGMTLDKLWNAGYPSVDTTLGQIDSAVASDDAMRDMVLDECRLLQSTHPHARGIINTDLAYVIGLGFKVEPTPRKKQSLDNEKIDEAEEPDADVDEPINIELRKKIKSSWKKYINSNKLNPKMKFNTFFAEAYKKCLKDGEVFIHLIFNEDISLGLRIIDPKDISHPSGTSVNDPLDPDMNGIRVDPKDTDKIIGYWFKNHLTDDKHVLIPAERMIHIKLTTDCSVKRGLPVYFVCRHYLNKFDKWLDQSLKHQHIQSQVAILRSWANTTGAQVKSLLDKKEWTNRDIDSPAGNTLSQKINPIFPVIDAPANMTLTMASPNGNWQESEILARRIMLGIASGSGMSELMASGDASASNYNAILAAQFPAIRSKEQEQELWKDVVKNIYTKWLLLEKLSGRIDIKNEEEYDCVITESRIPNYEAMLSTMATIQLKQTGVISNKTAQELVNIDPDAEKQRLKDEPKVETEDPSFMFNKVKPKGQLATVGKKSHTDPLPSGKKKGLNT